MSKIAIDIALIPPLEILNRLIEINRSLQTSKQELSLGLESTLPHLSISMGVIDEEKIPELWKKISSLAETIAPLHFKSNSIRIALRADGVSKISDIDCEHTKEMQQLHEKVIAITKSYFGSKASLDMFIPSAFLRESSAAYINDSWPNKSMGNYDPHITLGLGEPKNLGLNLDFYLSRLTICHLGAYTTCAKVLLEKDLT